jgi:uncharacterized membrane protein YbhN (UPF0104 family)
LKIKKLIEYIKWLWIAVVIVAVGYYLVTNWDSIGGFIQQLSPLNLILSVFFIILAKLLLAIVSKLSIEKEGYTLDYLDVFRVVSFTHLAKYIPGGIWHFVGRFNAYNEREMKLKSSTRALIHENLWLLSGAFFTGGMFGVISSQGQELLEAVGIRIPIYILLLIIILLWVLALVGYEKLMPANRSIQFYWIFMASLLAWIFLGMSFGFILPGNSTGTSVYYISIYAFGWILGYVAIFAPGGIGIRETALVWLLGGIVAPDLAIVYSSVHRFVFIIGEIILGGASIGLVFLGKARSSDSEESISSGNRIDM